MAKGTRAILLQVKCLLPCQLSETEPIPVITYFILSKPVWVVTSLLVFALGFPVHLGTCVSASQDGHSHQLLKIRAPLHQTDCTFISQVFASHLDSLHMNKPPILPSGLKTE